MAHRFLQSLCHLMFGVLFFTLGVEGVLQHPWFQPQEAASQATKTGFSVLPPALAAPGAADDDQLLYDPTPERWVQGSGAPFTSSRWRSAGPASPRQGEAPQLVEAPAVSPLSTVCAVLPLDGLKWKQALVSAQRLGAASISVALHFLATVVLRV